VAAVVVTRAVDADVAVGVRGTGRGGPGVLLRASLIVHLQNSTLNVKTGPRIGIKAATQVAAFFH